MNQKIWIDYYEMLYGNEVYKELNTVLLQYYKNTILSNISANDETINFIKILDKLEQKPLYELWSVALSMIAINNKESTIPSNENVTTSEHEQEKETENNDNEDEENANIGEYTVMKMLDLLKTDLSFKQIANVYKKERDAIISDFVKYVRKNEKAKKLDDVLKKYNIIYKNDKLVLEKILSIKTKTSYM